MFLGIEHGGFIVTAFALFALSISVLIAWVVIDRRSLDRIEADLQARGLRRRSTASAGGDGK